MCSVRSHPVDVYRHLRTANGRGGSKHGLHKPTRRNVAGAIPFDPSGIEVIAPANFHPIKETRIHETSRAPRDYRLDGIQNDGSDPQPYNQRLQRVRAYGKRDVQHLISDSLQPQDVVPGLDPTNREGTVEPGQCPGHGSILPDQGDRGSSHGLTCIEVRDDPRDTLRLLCNRSSRAQPRQADHWERQSQLAGHEAAEPGATSFFLQTVHGRYTSVHSVTLRRKFRRKSGIGSCRHAGQCQQDPRQKKRPVWHSRAGSHVGTQSSISGRTTHLCCVKHGPVLDATSWPYERAVSTPINAPAANNNTTFLRIVTMNLHLAGVGELTWSWHPWEARPSQTRPKCARP